MSKLILMQYEELISSRTFLTFANENDLIKHIFKLAKKQIGMKGILVGGSNKMNDLEAVTEFICSLYDFAYYENVNTRYIPYGKTGFINKLVEYLENR